VSAAAPRRRFAEAIATRRLDNGACFFVLENRFNPTVSISGSMFAGPLFAPPSRRLLAAATAGELLKGTSRRSKLEIAESLESRGASLAVSADASDPVGVDIVGSALSRDVELLLDTLAEVLREPSFPEEELEKEKKRLVGAIRQQEDNTGARAWAAATRHIYPEGHPMRRRTAAERIASVESLGREELAAYHRTRYGAANFHVAVAGDVDAGTMLDGLARRFSDWRPGPAREVPGLEVPSPSPAREDVVLPDKPSADVVLMEPSDLSRPSGDFLACSLANSALGQSSLTSRLGLRVRDTEGLTYGIHSSFAASHVAGPFAVTLTVKPESRDAAVASALDEIRKFLDGGMTDKELVDEKSARVGRFLVDLASSSGLASAIDTAVYYGFGIGYLDEFPDLVSAVTRAQAQEAFTRRVHPERFTIVSAGSFGLDPRSAP
jgi:zinc protease